MLLHSEGCAIETVLVVLDGIGCAPTFNFVSALLGGATTEYWSWKCGKIWGFCPSGDTINRFGVKLAVSIHYGSTRSAPNLATIG